MLSLRKGLYWDNCSEINSVIVSVSSSTVSFQHSSRLLFDSNGFIPHCVAHAADEVLINQEGRY